MIALKIGRARDKRKLVLQLAQKKSKARNPIHKTICTLRSVNKALRLRVGRLEAKIRLIEEKSEKDDFGAVKGPKSLNSN